MRVIEPSGGRGKRRGWSLAATSVGVCLVALLVAGCASQRVPPYEQGADRYRFTIELTQRLGETGTCSAAVAVTDLAAKRKLAIPLFTARWGATAESSAVDTTYGARLEATVLMAGDGSKGECRAVLHRGDDLIASRAATIPVVVVRTSSKLKFP